MIWKDNETIQKNIKYYSDRHQALRFLLGGIGTGNISINAAGKFCDFELFNQPNKGVQYPYNFFAIWSKHEGDEADARILEAYEKGIDNKGLGNPMGELLGLPRFDSTKFYSQYPFANIEFNKENYGLQVSMEAFTPFIPLDSKNSGMPMFSIKYSVKNILDKPADVAICGTMINLCGHTEFDGNNEMIHEGKLFSNEFSQDGLMGLNMGVDGIDEHSLNYGTMAIGTTNSNVTTKPAWDVTTGWCDLAEDFWQDFQQDGELKKVENNSDLGEYKNNSLQGNMVGSVCAKEKILPGQTVEFTFYVSWNFPNRYGWWPNVFVKQATEDTSRIYQNYYSACWADALDVIKYFERNKSSLVKLSRDFSNALYSSTLPADVIEALVCSITALRSTTCFRTSDGKFWGWEGSAAKAGSCHGNCTHVWNYAQTVAFLFPELEQDVRKTDFLLETNNDGNMQFRSTYLLGGGRDENASPAADGQPGSILRAYREWKLSGDDEFIKTIWDKMVLSMEFAAKEWDADSDGIFDSRQHNTYDIEFYGINSLTNSIFIAAQYAMGEMAKYLGHDDLANEYHSKAQASSEKLDKLLWNGEYYIQKISDDDLKKCNYQYGSGCLSDQIFGQQLASLYDLDYVLPKDHVVKALQSIYKYNFKKTFENHCSVQRTYTYQDEAGLVLCAWPNGGRPNRPFPYSDEVWSGIEYQVATNLIYEGMIDQSIEIVEAIRKRHDGFRRSPYNEVECGNHYVRSMAAWGLLVSLSGYKFDLPNNAISFEPKVNEQKFSCFFSNAKSWGVYTQQVDESGNVKFEITPLFGNLDGIKIN